MNKSQWYDKKAQVWYIYDHNNVLERIHYSDKPHPEIPITTVRHDLVKTHNNKRIEPVNYLANKLLLEEHKRCLQQDEMSEKFALYVQLLIYRWSNSSRFIRNPIDVREDMRSLAFLTILKNFRKFNHERSDSIFSWLTQTATNSFLQIAAQQAKQYRINDAIRAQYGSDQEEN